MDDASVTSRTGHWQGDVPPEQGFAIPARGRAGDYDLSAPADLPTRFGVFTVRICRDDLCNEHALISLGEVGGAHDVLVRVHSQCLTGETFGCLRCDCRQQLEAAMRHIAEAGSGLIIYLRQEGRGIGLFNKIEAYALQDRGLDTVAANHALGLPEDCRGYDSAVDLLRLLGVRSVQLLTNNPRKIQWLTDHGIQVTRRIAVHVEPNSFNIDSLNKARQRLSHSP